MWMAGHTRGGERGAGFKPQTEAGFLAVGSAFVNGADLGSFVERGSDGAQRNGGGAFYPVASSIGAKPTYDPKPDGGPT